MYFLSIESSTRNFSVAISCDDKVVRYKTIRDSRRLEDVILKNIESLLKAAKLPFKKMDAFVISLGPGSFTSLRVGLSTVKAFCLATQKPIVGVCSLDIIAEGVLHMDCDEICVVVDARRNMVYSAIYQKTKQGLFRSKPYALSPIQQVLDDVKGRTVFVGDALGLYQEMIIKAYKTASSACVPIFASKDSWLPKAKGLARLGFERLQDKKFDDAATIVPIYLYEDSCQVDKSHVQGK